nr:hypothetical protein CFP56_09305 [Quercus suber]
MVRTVQKSPEALSFEQSGVRSGNNWVSRPGRPLVGTVVLRVTAAQNILEVGTPGKTGNMPRNVKGSMRRENKADETRNNPTIFCGHAAAHAGTKLWRLAGRPMQGTVGQQTWTAVREQDRDRVLVAEDCRGALERTTWSFNSTMVKPQQQKVASFPERGCRSVRAEMYFFALTTGEGPVGIPDTYTVLCLLTLSREPTTADWGLEMRTEAIMIVRMGGSTLTTPFGQCGQGESQVWQATEARSATQKVRYDYGFHASSHSLPQEFHPASHFLFADADGVLLAPSSNTARPSVAEKKESKCERFWSRLQIDASGRARVRCAVTYFRIHARSGLLLQARVAAFIRHQRWGSKLTFSPPQLPCTWKVTQRRLEQAFDGSSFRRYIVMPCQQCTGAKLVPFGIYSTRFRSQSQKARLGIV